MATKIVLSPCLIELMSEHESEECEMEHLTHLQSILDFLCELSVEFDYYENAPYIPDSLPHPPISRYHYHQISCIELYKKILNKICYEDYIDLSEYIPSELVTLYDYPKQSETKESFLRYITYLVLSKKAFLLFIGLANKDKPHPFTFSVTEDFQIDIIPILEPEVDCSGQIASIMASQTSDEIFPNKRYCSLLNTDFLKKRHTEDRKALISKVGDEVAFRNGYSKNDYLSMLNSRKQRSMRAVYSKLGRTATYLSLDFESGGFEVFDKNGQHLGQYSFDGVRTKLPAPNTHKLYFS